MAKPNKESIITDILIELNGVNNQRGEVLAKVGNKWQLSERTFDRIWKDANSRHEIIQFEQQKVALANVMGYLDILRDLLGFG